MACVNDKPKLCDGELICGQHSGASKKVALGLYPSFKTTGRDSCSSEREGVYGRHCFWVRNQGVPNCKGTNVIIDLEERVDSLFEDCGGLSERRRRIG